jgi:hypothetical protein
VAQLPLCSQPANRKRPEILASLKTSLSLATHRNELLADQRRPYCPVTPYHTSSQHTANMPSQVTDIKQFIEICRRKDASCAFFLSIDQRKKKNAKTNIGCYPKQLPASRRPPPSRSSSRSAASVTSTPSSSRTRTRPRS